MFFLKFWCWEIGQSSKINETVVGHSSLQCGAVVVPVVGVLGVVVFVAVMLVVVVLVFEINERI